MPQIMKPKPEILQIRRFVGCPLLWPFKPKQRNLMKTLRRVWKTEATPEHAPIAAVALGLSFFGTIVVAWFLTS